MPQAVYFLMLPQVLSLDVSGPAETLRLAGQFSLHYISPVPQVTCSVGMTLSQLQPLPDRLEDGAILVVPGVSDSQHFFANGPAEQARRWLAALQPDLQQQRITLVCVCSGALLAAQAGLLDGYQCTTHHDVIERMRQQAPAAQVKENRIFVEDRSVYTSAGITAGIDLALHLINRQCGASRAMEIAREMVVYFRRSGDDPQLSPWLRYRNHLHPAVHRAQDVMAAEPEAEWSVPQVAEKAHVSSRHLARLFRSHVGISVREYHEQLRLAVAQQRLQQGYGLEKAALAAGFSSGRQLRRAQQRGSIGL
ncbi:transcriptional activator FtrA [Serratia quinivorans]|jgi:transcriptional regulator GlxA family with amidase domain|uniref:GlxA family transcriptional regulator n=1 Tax=Serratia quinivorans TaxID=137545 RepID=A0A379ZEA9_9GAMM|nr:MULTISPECIES: helix-turn-helix domain-containing protein [Serratia]QBX67539.1 helix-turn-helix domain-containing protein [Serratia quinivorans]RYM64947.1 AraC family transcriptional regulator [Serratia proteamaculans]CAI1004513.1 transcriptional activator FtrA [Serratia quinivorans]CAI1136028.1 transcriptional activator FtrA [Serratia quinivorans]CAI1542595.1 transcriptional activator FtrA [Serratia quinivorans]